MSTDFQAYSSTHYVDAAVDWNQLLDHGLEKAASYVIRKNGSYYEAVNGSTGKIDYGGPNGHGSVSGTDATAVIQSAVDALTGGGRIFLKEGVYELSSPISLQDKAIIFEGAGWTYNGSTGEYYGTILKHSGDVLKLDNTVSIFGQVVRNLLINGVDKSGDGLFINYAHEFLVEHVGIINCNNGVHLKGPASYHVSMFKEVWETNNYYGFLAEEGASHEPANNINVIGGRIRGDTVSVYVKGRCSKIKFYGTFISFGNTAIKIETTIEDSNEYLPDSISFIDCWIETASTDKTFVDFVLASGGTIYPYACEFIGNYFTGDGGTLNFKGNRHRIISNNIGGYASGTWNINLDGNDNVMRDWTVSRPWDITLNYSISGTGNKVKDNYGYVTEKNVLSGTFPVDSTGLKSVTLNHECDYTPSPEDVQVTIVEDTDVDDWWGYVVKVKDITSSQLTVDVYVADASATTGAKAKLSVRISRD